jgi:hypothetical protein
VTKFRAGMRIALAALVGLTICPALCAQSDQFWPSVNFYKTMNQYSRFYFQVQSTRENQTGQEVQIGPYLDLYLKRHFELLGHNDATAAVPYWL